MYVCTYVRIYVCICMYVCILSIVHFDRGNIDEFDTKLVSNPSTFSLSTV